MARTFISSRKALTDRAGAARHVVIREAVLAVLAECGFEVHRKKLYEMTGDRQLT
jgi:hypothetical protein